MSRPHPRAVALAALCLAFLAVPANAQDAPAAANDPALDLDAKIIADAAKTSEIMKNLGYLSDVIGPRLTGSANVKRANEWTAEVMKSYGLANVHLEPWEIPVGWERGTAIMKLVDPDNGRSLMVAAAGWTPGTKGKLVCDVVVINARTKADLEKYKGKLKDAVILRGEPQKIAPITDLSYPIGGGPRKKDNAKAGEKKDEPRKEEAKEAGKEPTPKNAGRAGMGFGDFAFRRELAEFIRAEGAAVMLQDSGKPYEFITSAVHSLARLTLADPVSRGPMTSLR